MISPVRARTLIFLPKDRLPFNFPRKDGLSFLNELTFTFSENDKLPFQNERTFTFSRKDRLFSKTNVDSRYLGRWLSISIRRKCPFVIRMSVFPQGCQIPPFVMWKRCILNYGPGMKPVDTHALNSLQNGKHNERINPHYCKRATIKKIIKINDDHRLALAISSPAETRRQHFSIGNSRIAAAGSRILLKILGSAPKHSYGDPCWNNFLQKMNKPKLKRRA